MISIHKIIIKSFYQYLVVLSSLSIISAHSAPEGGSITHGLGTIDVLGNETSISQTSDNLIIDWNSFNVSPDEEVIFNQPSEHSVAINNILQYDASEINGRISANGKVILINPRGIIFGENSQINTSALIASSLSLLEESFLNGEYIFKDFDDTQGVIINNGTIKASMGVSLVGESVINNGLVQAQLGYINLAAGRQAYLTFDELGFMGIKIDQEVINNDLGLKQLIENNGQLSAAGRVAITAQASSGLFDRAINNTGIVKATGFNHQPGNVYIEGPQVIHSGVIDVSNDAGLGGQIDVLGDQVGIIDKAVVNASGQQGGGVIHLGGSYQGLDENIRNAKATYIGKDVKISASAGMVGDGGEVVVWADETTRFYGNIESIGGEVGGNGGRVEVSGKESLLFNGSVDLSATNGEFGSLLLDPQKLSVVADSEDESDHIHDSEAGGQVDFSDIEEATIKASTLVNLLDSGKVNLTASELISIDSAISSESSNELQIVSDGDVDVLAAITTAGKLEINANGNTEGSEGRINLTGAIEANNIELIASSLEGNGSISISESLDLVSLNELSEFSGSVMAQGEVSQLFANNNHSFDLTTNDSEFKILDVIFTGFNEVTGDTGTVNSEAIDASYSILDSGSIEVNNIVFNQIATVAAGVGLDTAVGLPNQQWILTGGDRSVVTSDINFSNIDSVINGQILGTIGTDTFEILAEQSVLVNEMTFEGISTIDAQDHTDYVTGGSDWRILESGAESYGISFIRSEILTSSEASTLIGGSGTDLFIIEDTHSIATNGMTFNNITRVVGGDGNDDVQYDSGSWNVQQENEINLRGIAFSDIESVNVNNSEGVTERTLYGSSTDDAFLLEGENTVRINGITYYGIGLIDARTGGVDSIAGSDTWSILDTGTEAFDIEIKNVDEVISDEFGQLVGTDVDDIFNLIVSEEGDSAVMINDITFSNISLVSGGQGEDLVTTELSQAWYLTDDGSVLGNNINFSEVERINSSLSKVIGTLQEDSFEVVDGTRSVIANGTFFENVDEIDGNTATGFNDELIIVSDDMVTISNQDGVSTLDRPRTLSEKGLIYNNIDIVDVSTSSDVYSAAGFNLLNVSAKNLTIETEENVSINNLNVTDDLMLASQGEINFLKDANFTNPKISLSADSISFIGNLSVESNDFILEANELNVGGGIDVEVNVERSVPVDIGEDINASIFNDINIFVASDNSILITDAVENNVGFKNMLSESE